jgi:ATP-dependent Clp protease ATP-binding subunit ClpA
LTRELERERLEEIKSLQEQLETAKHELDVAQRQGEYERASRLRYSTIPDVEARLAKAEPPEGGLHDRVTSDDIARVVSRATGIPAHNLMKGERDRLVHVCQQLTSMRSFADLSEDERHPSWSCDWPGPCSGCGCERGADV